MRVLMISYSMPHRMTTGAEVCSQNYLDAIVGSSHDLDLVAYSRFGDDSKLPPNFYSAGKWHIETELAGTLAYWWLIRAYLTQAPYVITKFRSRRLVDEIRRRTSQAHYDCTVLDHTQLGWLLDYDLPKPIVFVAHNVESKIYAEQALDRKRNGLLKRLILRRDARLLRLLEIRMLQQCAQTWVLTDAEKQLFEALAPSAADRIRVFDLPGKPLEPETGRATSADIDVGILGGWLWEVNRRGLEWFMHDVVPLLPSTLRIHIAGNGAHAVPNPYPNVVYEGFVSSSQAFLRRCRVLVVPTVSGAGVQLKTIEGIAAGIPLVTTPIGLRGIKDVPGYVSSAQTAERMAELIADRLATPIASDPRSGAKWATARRSVFVGAVETALSALRGAQAAGGKTAARR
jgi:glycosyltransferase involved in cell wall biosynthesis